MEINYRNLSVDKFTSPCPVVVDEDTSIEEVLNIMKDNAVRHVPVTKAGKLVGILSERDLKVVAHLDYAKNCTASEIMVENPYSVNEHTTLEEVAFEMSSQKIGSAIVTDKEGNISGIFTSIDGLNALIEVLRGEILT